MKATVTSKKEKNKGEPETNARRQSKPSAFNEKGGPAGLPQFLNQTTDAPLVKQRVKVHPRLKSGAANNAHEQEADRAAENLRQAKNSSQVNDQQMRGEASGARLPEPTRELMEEELGADFSGVRIHSDSNANRLANSFGAIALTKGEDIYFNSNRYDPASDEGRALLAHELTHVTQQRGQAAGQVQFAFPQTTMRTALGYFEIGMVARTTPHVGMEGDIRFFPDPDGPYSAQIGLIQVVNVTRRGTRTSSTLPATLDWSRIKGGEAGRNELLTTGLNGAPPGWAVDSQTATHPRDSDAGPNYIEQWGLRRRNYFGWLRSPTDWRETSLDDYPHFNIDVDFDFETVAKATDTQISYGTLEWGFQIRSGAVLNEYARVHYAPSATFNEALERFRGYFTYEPIVIYFDTDDDEPYPGEAPKIIEVLGYLNRYPDVRIHIDGYADEQGKSASNKDLAERRAVNVSALTVASGVNATRIETVTGHGETTEFAPGGALNEGTRRANRRVVMSFERTATTPIVMP